MLENGILVNDILEVCVVFLVQLVVYTVYSILPDLVSKSISDDSALLLKILSS